MGKLAKAASVLFKLFLSKKTFVKQVNLSSCAIMLPELICMNYTKKLFLKVNALQSYQKAFVNRVTFFILISFRKQNLIRQK